MTRHGLCMVGAIGSLVLASGCAPLQTVDRVDLERYTGLWYEIARYPNFFQSECYGGTTAEYSILDDGRVRVVNRCHEDALDGPVQVIEGTARVVDTETNAKLSVSFGGVDLGFANYWILALDPEYQWALVGEPTRQTLWILARTPSLDASTYDAIVSRLSELGYDPSRLVQTPQPPGG